MNQFRCIAYVLNLSIVVVKYGSKSQPIYGVQELR